MIKPAITHAFRFSVAALSLALLSACGSLLPTPAAQPQRYSLDQAGLNVAPTPASKQGPTLIVNPPRAASGFDSQRINYVRQPHLLEYYAQSEWVDTPARMLAPLIVSAIENTGAFRAVILTPLCGGAPITCMDRDYVERAGDRGIPDGGEDLVVWS